MMCARTSLLLLTVLAVATALPSSDEVVSSDEAPIRAEAEQSLELLQAQGMGDNACADLADSTIKEINTAISNQQKVLDALDKGSKCKTEGDANVRAMEKAYNAAKDAYKKADQAVSAATKTKVSFKSLSLDTAMKLKNSGKCGKFYEGASFRGAQSAYNTAKKQRDSANAQVKASKSAWDKSKIAAAKAKEDCACKARDEMNKAWAAASQSKVRADNDKAWRKAQQMKCVIKGVSMGSCKYAATPVTKKPSLASGVAAMCKRGAAGVGGFQFTALTKVSCPSGTGPIFSEATCKTAMKALTGKSVSSVGKHCWKKHPQGCFTHYPKNKSTRILMNNPGCGLKSGTTYHDTAAICAGSASKAPLKCTVSTKASNSAGVVKPSAKSGTLVGGGINNHYRSWNSKAGFEQMYPDGNHYNCDMGFGPGKLTCYGIYCSQGGALDCTTRSTRFHGSGSRSATLPAGYTMTGGGLVNHYRHWNAKAGFEGSEPSGNNKWHGDMGFGSGDYTVYVRGCKGVTCVTVKGKRGNSAHANCPAGYTVTGCGIVNHYRHWNAKSGFEQTNPHGNGCLGDAGFGAGDQTTYARCCKSA